MDKRCKHDWVKQCWSTRIHICKKCERVRTRDFNRFYYWESTKSFDWYYKRELTQKGLTNL